MGKRGVKEYCNNTLTEAAFRGRIINTLRRLSMGWKPKTLAFDNARDGYIKNPKTGKDNQAFRCEDCGERFMKKDLKADHIDPVVPLEGFKDSQSVWLGYDWSVYLKRLLCEVRGFQILCHPCHETGKTQKENEIRRSHK